VISWFPDALRPVAANQPTPKTSRSQHFRRPDKADLENGLAPVATPLSLLSLPTQQAPPGIIINRVAPMDTESSIATRDELIRNPEMQRPHVVILGAGASVAACPEGDRNGRRLPTMDNFIEILGLRPLLEKYGCDPQGNFEVQYSSLCSDKSKLSFMRKIETAVQEYFSSLELPDYPTEYDYLLLSLRRKDAVFTFNWDPFLFDAWVRNRRFGLPRIFFLHGNVRAAYCPSHPTKWGAPWAHCPECRTRLAPSKLLYPVKIKNYASDQFIASAWDAAKWFLESAFTLTIFGYSAPSSDTEAVDLMKNAWNRVSQRLVERVEIIDLKSKDALYDTWKQFISHYHYDCRSYFSQSYIAKYPRRSGKHYTPHQSTAGPPSSFQSRSAATSMSSMRGWSLLPNMRRRTAFTTRVAVAQSSQPRRKLCARIEVTSHL
jgi:hypothetical protein